MLGGGARFAVPEQFDGEQVRGAREVAVGVLRAVEVGVGQEGVYHHQRWFAWVQGAGGLVGG